MPSRGLSRNRETLLIGPPHPQHTQHLAPPRRPPRDRRELLHESGIVRGQGTLKLSKHPLLMLRQTHLRSPTIKRPAAMVVRRRRRGRRGCGIGDRWRVRLR